MRLQEFQLRTEAQARAAFWYEQPLRIARWRGWRREQNAYPCDVRVAWCEWVDAAERSGRMSADLAAKVVLA